MSNELLYTNIQLADNIGVMINADPCGDTLEMHPLPYADNGLSIDACESIYTKLNEIIAGRLAKAGIGVKTKILQGMKNVHSPYHKISEFTAIPDMESPYWQSDSDSLGRDMYKNALLALRDILALTAHGKSLSSALESRLAAETEIVDQVIEDDDLCIEDDAENLYKKVRLRKSPRLNANIELDVQGCDQDMLFITFSGRMDDKPKNIDKIAAKVHEIVKLRLKRQKITTHAEISDEKSPIVLVFCFPESKNHQCAFRAMDEARDALRAIKSHITNGQSLEEALATALADEKDLLKVSKAQTNLPKRDVPMSTIRSTLIGALTTRSNHLLSITQAQEVVEKLARSLGATLPANFEDTVTHTLQEVLGNTSNGRGEYAERVILDEVRPLYHLR